MADLSPLELAYDNFKLFGDALANVYAAYYPRQPLEAVIRPLVNERDNAWRQVRQLLAEVNEK